MAHTAVVLAAAAGGALSALLGGTPARAQEESGGPGVVYLRDGSVLQGALLDLIPGVGLQLRADDGTVHTIPREDVMRVERRAAPPDGPVRSRFPAPPGPLRARRVRPDLGTLHLAGAGGAALERANGAGAWTPVCFGPCDQPVPTTGTYRLGGADVRPSTPFQLAMPPGGRETLRAHVGSRSGFVAGIVVLAVGPALASGAAFAAVVDDAANHGDSPSSTDAAMVYGAVAVGAAAAVTGLVLMLVNASTEVRQVSTEAPAPAARLPPVPEMHEGQSAVPALAPALALPLISGRF